MKMSVHWCAILCVAVKNVHDLCHKWRWMKIWSLLILGMTEDIQVCLYTCLYWGWQGIYRYVYTPAYTGDDRGYTGMFIHLLILGMTGDIQVCLYTCLYWGWQGIYMYVYTPAYTRDDRGYTGMFIHLLILGMTGDIQVCLYTCLY